MPLLFISYRRTDSPDTVKLIYERLKKRLPRWEVFYDHESIPLGDPFPERLRAKVASAAVVLVIIGPKWLEILHERKNAAVDHVRAEVRLALEAGTSVVPILVGRAVLPTDADLADFPDLQPLLQRSGCPVRPDPDFDGDIDRIVAHVKQFDSDEAIGATLADKYTLTAEIGHGGMGVVYLAEQKQPVKRTVAVKLIKPGMDSRDVLARFDAERQALAVMDHPNIAKVHDAGMTAQGRPFFVMEYVKGVPITQYCDDKKLTPQERLNLFIPVCNAVQHAHQKGIIHRDLKPSNVLVEVIDGKPVAKVIDFGLAKALGPKLTDMTQPPTALDMRIGTLEYSAPEQAAGRSFDVDTRSDIYSLGVLLYELLTGAPPFTHAELLKIGEEEMRRVIREDEPTTPSKKLSSSGALPAIAANRQLEPNKLTRLVRGDLDWIVMKCLEKENARRYESANQLGQELQRFLADEPVQAGPPSAVYRLRKFVRRHKASLLTAAGVLLATVLGVAIAFWQIRAAWQNEKNAKQTVEQEKENVQKEQQKTAAELEKSREAEKLSLDTIRSVVNDIHAQLKDKPASQELRKKLLKTAEDGLKKVARNAETAGVIDHAAVVVHMELGDIFLDLDGATADALTQYELAHALAVKLAAADQGSPLSQRDLSVSLNRLGNAQMQSGDTKVALDSYQQSLAIDKKIAVADPGSDQAQRDLSVSLSRLGNAQMQSKDTKAALECYQQSLAIAKKLAAAEPGSTQAQRDLCVSFEKVGDAHMESSDTKRELSLYQQTLEMAKRFDALSPSISWRLHTNADRHKDAAARMQSRDAKAALDNYQQSLAIAKKLAATEPGNAQAQRDLSVSFNKVGNAQMQSKDTKAALESYQQSLAIAQKLAAAEPGNAQGQRDLSVSLNKVGNAQMQSKDTKAALQSYQQSLAIAKKLAEADPGNAQGQRDLFIALYNAACSYSTASKSADADGKTKAVRAAKAVTLLREAREKGYFKTKENIDLLKQDTDLDPLRERDFNALLAELVKDAKLAELEAELKKDAK